MWNRAVIILLPGPEGGGSDVLHTASPAVVLQPFAILSWSLDCLLLRPTHRKANCRHGSSLHRRRQWLGVVSSQLAYERVVLEGHMRACRVEALDSLQSLWWHPSSWGMGLYWLLSQPYSSSVWRSPVSTPSGWLKPGDFWLRCWQQYVEAPLNSQGLLGTPLFWDGFRWGRSPCWQLSYLWVCQVEGGVESFFHPQVYHAARRVVFLSASFSSGFGSWQLFRKGC